MPRADLELAIRRARLQQAADERLFVNRPRAGEILNLASASVRDLCERGKLIFDKGREPHNIWVPSIYDFKVKWLIALGDPNDPPADARDVRLPQPPSVPDDTDAQSAMRALIAARQEARQVTEAFIKEARQATLALAEAQQAQQALVVAQQAQQALIVAQQALIAVLPRAPTKRERERAALIALKELGITRN